MPAAGHERELSPFSARRLLTLQQQQQGTNRPHHVAPSTTTRSKSRDRYSGNGSDRGRSGRPVTSPPRNRWDAGQEKRPRDARDRSRDVQPKDTLPEADAADRDRATSPEPYRPSPNASRDGKRERSRSRDRHGARDRSSERRKNRSHDRRQDRSRDSYRRRDRSGERRRDRSREKRRDRSRERHRSRSGSLDRHRDRKRRDRSRSPHHHHHRRRRSPSSSPPPPKRARRSASPQHQSNPRSKKPLPSQELSFRGTDNAAQPPSKYGGAPPAKEKPNFKPTGLLAKAANRVEGTKISLKYHEPAEARKPPSSAQWRLFIFKGDDVVDTIELWERSCWLFGRESKVVDVVLEHPSASGQHAVVQFRYIERVVTDEFGVRQTRGKVKPFVIDLESSNGTELNGEPLETSRYFELRDKDVLKFAGSEREYVVMLPPKEE
ncbi:SMAD/FHA domain-containing protein [Corynespora cassiicola Philippines]|uniref:SMAD/FHA domain-containing protein n=1 Tax=Corynespora cassiicola Philippines TaxID=1448308 RepID=A0A2T2NBS6_CORCC|nr:SMAD/FHA domain-containing protein [Corynespora cassiicola Philippines]